MRSAVCRLLMKTETFNRYKEMRYGILSQGMVEA